MNKLFLNGVYQAKMNTLISKDTYESLRNLKGEAFLQHLKELSFGANSRYLNIEDVFNYENKTVKEEINTLSESTIFSDIFYLKNDLTNIKIVYKSIYYDIEIDNFDYNSKFSKEALVEFFKRDNNALLKEKDLEILTKIKNINEKTLKKSLEVIEKTYYTYYLKKAQEFDNSLYTYLDYQIFVNNLLIFLKLRARNSNKEQFKELLLEESFVGINKWLDLFELNDSEIINYFSIIFLGKLANGINTYFKDGNLKVLKKDLNLYFKNLLLELSYDNNSFGSVTYFLYAKEAEIKTLRRLYYD